MPDKAAMSPTPGMAGVAGVDHMEGMDGMGHGSGKDAEAADAASAATILEARNQSMEHLGLPLFCPQHPHYLAPL